MISKGRQTRKLGDLCRIIRGASPRPKGDPRYFGEGIPWIKISDVTKDPGKYLYDTEECLTEEGRTKSVYLEPETLIVTNSATVAVPKILKIGGCIHDGFLALLDLSQDVDRDYLYYFFLDARDRLSEIAPQGTQKNLNTGIAKSIDIPLPPLETQRRVVAILDRVVNIQERQAEAEELANEMVQSVFLKTFGDPETNPMKWRKLPLHELAVIERDSVLPGNIVKGTKYVGLEHIEKNSGEIVGFLEVTPGDVKSNKFAFTPNHVLYGKLRPYLNKVAMPDFDGVCSTDILPILPRRAQATREYIAYLLKHPYFVAYATEKSTGANLPRISPKEIERFEAPAPAFDLQKRFSAFVSSLRKLSLRRKRSAQHSNELFQSLIRNAFHGGLDKKRSEQLPGGQGRVAGERESKLGISQSILDLG